MKAFVSSETTKPATASHIMCLVMLLAMSNMWATQTDLGRAPTGQVTRPGDLLKEPDGLELRFGYLPSVRKLRLLALRVPAGYTRWEAQLSKSPSDTPLCRWDGLLPFPKAGVTLDVPALRDGGYGLTVTMISSNGERREIRRTFERKRFSWENNPAATVWSFHRLVR